MSRISLPWFDTDNAIGLDSLYLPSHAFLLYSAFDAEFHSNPNGRCYGPTVGYQIPDSVLQVTGYEQLAQAVLKGLTVLLVLHPVVAALSFVGAFTSLFLDSHAMHIISLIFTIINSFLSSLVFAADLAIVIIAKDKVPGLTGGNFVIQPGNAVWMAVAGVILSWLGVILLSIPVCGCCGVSDMYNNWEAKRFKRRYPDPPEMTER